MKVFKPYLPAGEPKRIRRRLKKTISAAGRVRNHDIAAKLLSKYATKGKAAIVKRVKQDRRQAELTLTRLLKGRRDLQWYDRLIVPQPEDQRDSNRAAIADSAPRLLPRLAKEFFKRGNRAARKNTPPDELHRFRLSAKKFRYTLELFAPFYGPSLDSRLEEVKSIQSLLGDINDCETVRAMIAGWRLDPEIDVRLKKLMARKIGAFRRYWAKTFSGSANELGWRDYLRHS